MAGEPSDVLGDEIAAEHYGLRQIEARKASERARDIWSDVNPNAIGTSWAELLPSMMQEMSTSQLLVAAMSEPYLRAMVGTSVAAAGAANPAAFAGVASDGWPLWSLLRSPAITALTVIARGMAVNTAMERASRQLGMIVGTQIQDAGRVADGAGVAAREGVGYVRELRTPSCSRCVVLAGKYYRWNVGFRRHPRCDCTHRPATNSSDAPRFDEKVYFHSLSTADQNRTFTIAGAQAIRDGADIGQVINARRGMTAAGTIEGTTKRGLAGQRAAGLGDSFTKGNATSRYTRTGARLMPEQIYAMSSTRADAVKALRAAGFIV